MEKETTLLLKKYVMSINMITLEESWAVKEATLTDVHCAFIGERVPNYWQYEAHSYSQEDAEIQVSALVEEVVNMVQAH